MSGKLRGGVFYLGVKWYNELWKAEDQITLPWKADQFRYNIILWIYIILHALICLEYIYTEADINAKKAH